MTNFAEVWRSFTHEEKRNIAWYILGIMMYKLGLEFFNGSITTLATDRFRAANTFTKLGAAQGVNQAMQCVGAILIAPLVKALPTRTVLAGAVTFFALMTTLLLIIDAATGGSIKRAGATKPDYGSWNPNLIFVIWSLSGIAYGMVELIRRVIPADVVGGNVSKLRRMDATVHVLYEVAGTSGAFASSAAITRLGNNYSFLVSPIFFVLAAVAWSFVGALRTNHNEANGDEPALAAVDKDGKRKNYFAAVGNGAYLFCKSVGLGAWIVMSHRRFIWLFPGYALALYLHRFLESSLAPAFARRVLNVSAYSQIIVGGSNFGELLGAATVFLLSDYVPTPLPWLRLDALALNIVWILPRFSQIAKPRQVRWAWYIAACFIPISFGWAAGDVSLAAYIQSSLTTMDFAAAKDVSALGAVMAFLYSTYIVFNAVLSSVLGRVIDQDFTRTGTIYKALQQVGGIQFSVASALILLATLIPMGAFAFNPKMLNSMPLEGDVAHEEALDAEYVAKGADGTYGSDSDSVEREKKLAAISA
ncbi:BQ5605_C007g04460 [Microbotryum silenes-dioicae]|uniref:BQ5605_C007g04460 protein n=1 Tax=Microbotryum silenes-dioicae TaxID=796604 RepID=A0A2X0M770_9BASI|nr:BQ5605_C007g04460 [Microbotryum silenes-dioicae]